MHLPYVEHHEEVDTLIAPSSRRHRNQILALLGCISLISCASSKSSGPHYGSHANSHFDRDPAYFHISRGCELDPIGPSLQDLISEWQRLGIISRSEAIRQNADSPAVQAQKLTTTLPAFYFETDRLKREFDSKVKRGATLKELSRSGKGYARVLSARMIWEGLNGALMGYARDQLMSAKHSAARSPSGEEDLIRQTSKLLEKFFRDAAAQGTDHEALANLSLDTLLRYIDTSTRYLLSCEWDNEPFAGEQPGDPRQQKTTDYARQFAQKPLDEKILKVKRLANAGSQTGSVMRSLEPLMQNWMDTTTRAPFSDPVLVYKPDAGPTGNIKGDLFPKNTWAMTYDDGPGLKTTPTVLDHLLKLKTKATFFVLSQQIDKYPALLARELKEGHAIASHSYTHEKIPNLGETALKHEIEEAVADLEAKSGQKIRFFRLPYGAGVSVKKIRERLAANNLIHVFWNVDTLDWQDKNPDTIYQRALTQMKTLGRGVILFHDIHPQSVVASKMVLEYILKPENGLRSVTIPEIVDEQNTPPTAPPAPSPSPTLAPSRR